MSSTRLQHYACLRLQQQPRSCEVATLTSKSNETGAVRTQDDAACGPLAAARVCQLYYTVVLTCMHALCQAFLRCVTALALVGFDLCVSDLQFLPPYP